MPRQPERSTERRRALGRDLARLRGAAGKNQAALAAHTDYDRSSVSHIEHGKQFPDREFWQRADEFVGAGGRLVSRYDEIVLAERLETRREENRNSALLRESAQESLTGNRGLIHPEGSNTLLSVGGVPSFGNPLGVDYVEGIHDRIRQLVGLDIQFGGDDASNVAVQAFRSVHRKIGSAPVEPSVERDLLAAAGELAEVTGWLLYDAAKHDAVRRINQEALQLSQLAGDRSMQLLIMQNMSMHAGHLQRPREALQIARRVLETNKLSPRLEALFRTREARALAQGGAGSEARRVFAQARSLYLEGVGDSDPAWAWWINDQELAWHEAVINGDLDDWNTAADIFQESIDLTPVREVRRNYNHHASLLDAQTRVGAWSDAECTMGRLMHYVGEVNSSRTAETVLGAISRIDRANSSSGAGDFAVCLRDELELAGYR